MHFITGYSIPESHSPGSPHFGANIATLIWDKLENERKPAVLMAAAPPPRVVRRKVAQIRKIKKSLDVHIKESIIVLEYILQTLFPPVHQFNEGGERFIYTAAIF